MSQVGRRGTSTSARSAGGSSALILVADDVAGPGVLGLSALLTPDNGASPAPGRPGPCQLAAIAVTLSSHLKLPAVWPARRGRSAGRFGAIKARAPAQRRRGLVQAAARLRQLRLKSLRRSMSSSAQPVAARERPSEMLTEVQPRSRQASAANDGLRREGARTCVDADRDSE